MVGSLGLLLEPSGLQDVCELLAVAKVLEVLSPAEL